jgi:hypothetical protein
MNIKTKSLLSKGTSALILLLVFAFCFYEQHLGTNGFIYAIAVLILSYFTATNRMSWLVVLPLLVTSIAMAAHANSLTVVLGFVCLGFLAARMTSVQINPISSTALLALNFLIAPFRAFVVLGEGYAVDSQTMKRILSFIIIPAVFLLLFGLLYAGSNPIFENFLLRINWDFLDIQLFWIMVLGTIFSIVIFYFYVPPIFTQLSQSKNAFTVERPTDVNALMKHTWSVVFFSLSALLLVVISGDIYYKFILKSLPEGLTMSSYLHKGVFSLVISIMLSIFLIAYVFKKEVVLKSEIYGAVIFMALNILLILLNFMRNADYIGSYGLTMKRLGVYLYLSITLIGIVLSLFAIFKKMPVTQLITSNMYNVLFCVIAFTCFNWPRIITRYNLSQESLDKKIDTAYLLSFDYANIDLLYASDSPSLDADRDRIEYKVERFIDYYDRNDFRSLKLYDYFIYGKLVKSYKAVDHGE